LPAAAAPVRVVAALVVVALVVVARVSALPLVPAHRTRHPGM
jgi:hypothetical protein